jgi:hypothetical protein
MTTTLPSSDSSNRVVALATVVLGAVTMGYGFVLLSQSGLGAAWIAAIGLALVLSGILATDSAGRRLGLSPGTRRTLSLSFAAIAAFLLVAFVVVNGASFEFFEASGGVSSG